MKVDRKTRNRLSADRSRKKKKVEFEKLRETVIRLTAENAQLKHENSQLKHVSSVDQPVSVIQSTIFVGLPVIEEFSDKVEL